MELKLIREDPIGQAVFGTLYLDDNEVCYTLERLEVQIPCGTYPVEMTWSLHFNHLLPLLDNVPGRTAIRIHSGNWPRDSEGCILVGLQRGDDMILQSQKALYALVDTIQQALDSHDEVSISIS